MKHSKRHTLACATLAVTVAAVLSGCSGSSDGSSLEGGDGPVSGSISVAAVSNPQIQDLQELLPEFKKLYPDIDVSFSTLPEDTIKDRVTQDVAASSGQFDVVMMGPDQILPWARNGWLENLSPTLSDDEEYDADDLIPAVMESHSLDGNAYAVPFYAETAFLMYREDLFEDAGLTMPDKPTWSEVRDFAAALNDPSEDRAGICLRGAPTSGGAMGFTTTLPGYGAQMYDMDWNPTFTSEAFTEAAETYVDMQRNYGIQGASSASFPECLNAYSQGHAAMWYDATVAASVLESPDTSKVVGLNGYAPSPMQEVDTANWFSSWSFAVPTGAKNKAAAAVFVKWATSKDYIRVVGEELGWERVPPGTRTSTYETAEYKEAAEAFAAPTFEALNRVEFCGTEGRPQPYCGGGYLDTDFQQELMVKIGQEMSGAVAGNRDVSEALQAMQSAADQAVEDAGLRD